MFRALSRYVSVALLLAGSAILLYSCREEPEEDTSQDETMMTEFSEDLTIVMSQNGRKSYHFTTPWLEGYSLAKDPYREFRKGVKIVTYKADSASTVDATLTANYAIYYMKRDLWEAKGNVVVRAAGGERTLYTQQLFWNVKTKRIYSNVDSKIELSHGRDVFYGEGFESDDAMKDWRFRRMTGQMEFEMHNATDSAEMNAGTASSGSPAKQEQSRTASESVSAESAPSTVPAVSKKKRPAATLDGKRTPKPRKNGIPARPGGRVENVPMLSAPPRKTEK